MLKIFIVFSTVFGVIQSSSECVKNENLKISPLITVEVRYTESLCDAVDSLCDPYTGKCYTEEKATKKKLIPWLDDGFYCPFTKIPRNYLKPCNENLGNRCGDGRICYRRTCCPDIKSDQIKPIEHLSFLTEKPCLDNIVLHEKYTFCHKNKIAILGKRDTELKPIEFTLKTCKTNRDCERGYVCLVENRNYRNCIRDPLIPRFYDHGTYVQQKLFFTVEYISYQYIGAAYMFFISAPLIVNLASYLYQSIFAKEE